MNKTIPQIGVIVLLLVAGFAPKSPAHDDKFAGMGGLEWSVRMADSEINRQGDQLAYRAGRTAKWDYPAGALVLAVLQLNELAPDPQYVEFCKDTIGSFIAADGSLRGYDLAAHNLASLVPGRAALELFERTKEARYRKAADRLRAQLDSQPRTTAGGFWPTLGASNQISLEGVGRSAPFYAQYTQLAKADATNYADIALQFRLVEQHSFDRNKQLFFPAWDESRQQLWADKSSGRASNCWARALGGYAAACVETLEFLPKNHAARPELVTRFERVAEAILKWQDPGSALWWQVLDQGGRADNYLEASASCLFVYALAKGLNDGYLAPEFPVYQPDGALVNNNRYVEAALNGYLSIVQRFLKRDARGDISLIRCAPGGKLGDGSYDSLVTAPQIYNDLTGVSAFIKAGIEVQKLQKRPMRLEFPRLGVTPWAQPAPESK